MATTYTPTINRIYKITEFDLLRTQVKMGNMYMCLDTQKLYYDGGNTADSRNLYNYIAIRTVNELFYEITPDYGKTYYCWEDNSLWVWLNKWISLYSETTYPSAYVYSGIPTTSSPQEIGEIFRYDMPNMPADDNGLLKDGSVIVRDRNRLIKGKISISDNNDNLIISSFLGGGIKILPNGKMSTDGELYIDNKLVDDKQVSFATLRAELSLLNNEAYINYAEHPELDDSEYPNAKHIYKVFHEGNLDTSAIKTMTPLEIYNKLLDTEGTGELPNIFDFNVKYLNGHESSYFANRIHTHNYTDVTGLTSAISTQAGIAVKSIFNNINGTGVTGNYDISTEVLNLSANSFRLSLTGGATGASTIQHLTDTTIELTVDPTKHTHNDYILRMDSLQNQINALDIDTNMFYNKSETDTLIASVTPTIQPTPGKALEIDLNGILPATSESAKKLDHNITLNLTGDITGTTTFDGSTNTINLATSMGSGQIIENAVATQLATKYFSTTIGDGTSTTYMVIHTLNTTDFIIQFRDVTTNKQVYLSNTTLDNSTVQVESSTPINANQIKVYMYKVG